MSVKSGSVQGMETKRITQLDPQTDDGRQVVHVDLDGRRTAGQLVYAQVPAAVRKSLWVWAWYIVRPSALPQFETEAVSLQYANGVVKFEDA